MVCVDMFYTQKGIIMSLDTSLLIDFVKERRKKLKLTQTELASKAGVGLRFIRELEQGKKTLRMDKVNQVLILFGHQLGPIPVDRDKLIAQFSTGKK
jgi:y4mF family transcriptional regulator